MLAAFGLIAHRLEQFVPCHGLFHARRRTDLVTVGGGDRADLAEPLAGHCAAYFATVGSMRSTTGAGHGPFAGSPPRWRAKRPW